MVTEKVVEVAPCGITTLVGTVAAFVFELESDTDAPPAPAAAERLTVPMPVCPLVRAVGLTETPVSVAAGLTFTVKVLLTPESEAVIVAELLMLTLPAVTVKTVDAEPWGTMMLAGTVTAGLELDNVTIAPPTAAIEVRVTVPVADCPELRVAGATEILFNAAAGALTITPAVLLIPE